MEKKLTRIEKSKPARVKKNSKKDVAKKKSTDIVFTQPHPERVNRPFIPTK